MQAPIVLSNFVSKEDNASKYFTEQFSRMYLNNKMAIQKQFYSILITLRKDYSYLIAIF